MILIDILEEHLEEADFLFQQRENALKERVYNLDGLAELEERLLAHLDGLVLAEKDGWKLLEPKLADGELGEIFAAAFVAFDSGDRAQMELVTKTFEQTEGGILDGIRHAWRHISYVEIERIVRPYLAAENATIQAAAVDVLSFRRLPFDRSQLSGLLNHKDLGVVVSAINAVGRLRVRDLKEYVERALDSAAPQVRGEAMRTGLLLGSDRVLTQCRKAVKDRSEMANEAMILVGLTGQAQDAPLLVDSLSDLALARNAVVVLGLHGNLGAIDVLLRLTADPKHSRLAGEAVSRITGLNLEQEKLVTDQPAKVSKGPANEEEEEFVEDPDEDLPCPDPEKLEAWWWKNVSRFDKKIRYRNGQPYGPQVLMDILQMGSLPERHYATFELALINPSYPYLETYAFNARQRSEMASLNIFQKNSRKTESIGSGRS
jgi:uncharacterized protein (TIGR02270 family)